MARNASEEQCLRTMIGEGVGHGAVTRVFHVVVELAGHGPPRKMRRIWGVPASTKASSMSSQ